MRLNVALMQKNSFVAKIHRVSSAFLYNEKILVREWRNDVVSCRSTKDRSGKEEIRRIDPAYPVFVDAILDGVIQGDLYVDHRDHPCVYFAGTTTGIYYVAGRTEAALSLCSTFIVDVYKSRKEITDGSLCFQQIQHQMR